MGRRDAEREESGSSRKHDERWSGRSLQTGSSTSKV
jgi:hypothetical protein